MSMHMYCVYTCSSFLILYLFLSSLIKVVRDKVSFEGARKSPLILSGVPDIEFIFQQRALYFINGQNLEFCPYLSKIPFLHLKFHAGLQYCIMGDLMMINSVPLF